MSLSRTVAANIQNLRLAQKLTQSDLAKRARISTSYVSMLERGQRTPPLETLEVLAKALRVPALRLLERAAKG